MEQPCITVVVPVYNQETYISTCIESVISQSYTNWNLLIMDDASTDRTAEVISQYLRDGRIRYVRLPINGGTGKTLAEALTHIDTPYFVILDSDDWLEKAALQVLLEEMEKQPPSTSLVYSNTIIWKQYLDGTFKIKVRKHQSYQDKYEFMFKTDMVYPRFFRTQSVIDVGGFDNEIPYQGRYMEDRYLLLKLIENSHFHWVDQNLYNLRRHHFSITNQLNRAKFAEVKRYVFKKMLKKWGDHYKPVFKMRKDGWLHLKELKPKKKKK